MEHSLTKFEERETKSLDLFLKLYNFLFFFIIKARRHDAAAVRHVRTHSCVHARRVPGRTRRRTTRCPSARHCADLTLDEHTNITDNRSSDRRAACYDVRSREIPDMTSLLVGVSLGTGVRSSVIDELNASIYKSIRFVQKIIRHLLIGK